MGFIILQLSQSVNAKIQWHEFCSTKKLIRIAN